MRIYRRLAFPALLLAALAAPLSLWTSSAYAADERNLLVPDPSGPKSQTDPALEESLQAAFLNVSINEKGLQNSCDQVRTTLVRIFNEHVVKNAYLRWTETGKKEAQSYPFTFRSKKGLIVFNPLSDQYSLLMGGASHPEPVSLKNLIAELSQSTCKTVSTSMPNLYGQTLGNIAPDDLIMVETIQALSKLMPSTPGVGKISEGVPTKIPTNPSGGSFVLPKNAAAGAF